MKRHLIYSLFVLFVLFVASADAQNKAVNTANIDFHFSNEKVIITYDIVNSSPNELYTITVSVFRKNGSKLNVVSLSGDLKEIPGGTGKTIIWEQNKDGYVLDEEIYVTLALSTKVSIPVGTHLLKSLVFPGLGDYRIRNGKYHFIYGLVGYGAIGASVYFNSMAAKNYTSYKNSFDYNESNGFFNKAKQQQSLSYVFAGTACIVWTVDLACLYGKASKVKKQITEQNSKYYYDKGQQTNTFTSTPSFINTKLPYDLAMERGDKAFADEKYEDAKKAYEEAGKFKLTPTVDIKLETVNNKIADENRKTLEYNATIANGENLLNEKKYEEAKKSFTAASHIKPKEKYPDEKIKEIEEIQSKIENERLYNEQMAQGNALLKNKNYSDAILNFQKALTYNIKDITATNKLKECEDAIAAEKQKQTDAEYKNIMALGNNQYSQNKFETATAFYNQALSLKPESIEAKNKIEECDFYIRLNTAKEETDIDYKITLLENLKNDYPLKSSQLDKLISEAKKHKQIRIPLTLRGNTHTLKVKVNNILTFDFILDTGADNVLVSRDVFITYYKAGVITKDDIIGNQSFSIADGSVIKGLKFYLKEIQIGDLTLKNVEGSVIDGNDYDMLLGGSVFKKIGKITIDYDNSVLIIEK